MTLLDAVDVCKHFGGVRALDGVDLSVDVGIMGIIGPNGSGKTTLVNVCSGVYAPNGGSVTFRGAPLPARRSTAMVTFSKRGIARTFQKPHIFGGMTVLENVLIGAEQATPANPVSVFLGLPAGRRAGQRALTRARECLELVGIPELADRPADALPLGVQHFVEIARAVATDPQLLFLDEPAAGLNDSETAELTAVVRRVAESGIGIALIEHNVSFVLELCARICVLNFGKKIADGTPDEIVNDEAVLTAYLGTEEEAGHGDADGR